MTAAEPAPSPVRPGIGAAPDEALLQAVQAATSVVKAHRMHGHLAARLDPLGSDPESDPALDPATVNLTPELMQAIPASSCASPCRARPSPTRCRTSRTPTAARSPTRSSTSPTTSSACGCARRSSPASTASRSRPRRSCALLERLTEVDTLETYLHKTFLGKKQFSIEGLDMLVPMLDETIELASLGGAREVVIGMAHRGRLNVLAHTVGRSYQSILVEFEGESNLEADTAMPEGGTGDVKYHHGAQGTRKTRTGKGVKVTLSPNPSHLEFVDPVVEGRARADQSSRDNRKLEHDPSIVLPLLVHGDAAFPGQGTVAETLNLQGARGLLHRRHGPHHHQQPARLHDRPLGVPLHPLRVGPREGLRHPDHPRERRRRRGLHRGGAARARRSARSSAATSLIDLIGYRRFGHNEQDEPAYTQPQMYEAIKQHPPVRKIYADQLVTRA